MSEQLTADELPTVHQLMGRVLAELPAIGKDDQAPNDMGGYKFRGIESITAALKPLLGKHGLFCVPSTLDRRESVRVVGKYEKNMYVVDVHVRFTFYGPGGDWLECSTWGEGTDMGDKATQKAYTSAFKSMLAVAFTIADSETDAERHSVPETTPTIDDDTRESLRARISALPEQLRAELKIKWADLPSLRAHRLDSLPVEHVSLVESLVAAAEAQERAEASQTPARASESDADAQQAAAQPELASVTDSASGALGLTQAQIDERAPQIDAEKLLDSEPPDDWVRAIIDETKDMPAADVDAELKNWTLPKGGNLTARRRRLAVAKVRDALRPPG